MSNLANKVAIVTGAERGIGRAIAERLAQDGAAVVLNYFEKKADADTVVAGIEARGGRALAVQVDISQQAQVAELFARCQAAFGRPDILVNDAGVAVLMPLTEVTENEFNHTFNTNAKGTLFCLSEAARHLNDNGRIVNISSSTVPFPIEGAAIYAGSKAAIKAFTEVAARELGPRGITVNAVMPGVTETHMTEHFTAEFKQQIADTSPLKRLGQPVDIAATVALLVSNDAYWITGQSVVANGGGKA